MDITHDYMAEIYKHVVNSNIDIYEKIEEDCVKYLNDDYNQDNKDKCYFDDWLSEYIHNLNEENKMKIISKYGYRNLIEKLPEISKVYCFNSIEWFIEDGMSDDCILNYIVKEEILKNKYDDLKETYWTEKN